MLYREYIPHRLSGFVEKIWYCSAVDLTSANLTIPLLHHELVFNFSDKFCIQKTGENSCAIENPLVWINGLQTKSYYSYSSGRHEMAGVLFKPEGLKAFWKGPVSEFSNGFTDASLVFGKPLLQLTDQLREVSCVQTKMHLLEDFLVKLFIQHQLPGYLLPSAGLLSESIGAKGAVKKICKELSVSNKSLISAFDKYIGINPVKYTHLHAINKAIALLAKDPGQSLTGLAYQLNFYDQAHFITLFRSITSLTPSQYAGYVTDNKTDAATANFIATG